MPRALRQTPLVRLTVNLTQRSVNALNRLAERTGYSRTDIINRALQVYDYVDDILDRGGELLIYEPDEDEPRSIKFF